jgi:hypothetical protein
MCYEKCQNCNQKQSEFKTPLSVFKLQMFSHSSLNHNQHKHPWPVLKLPEEIREG